MQRRKTRSVRVGDVMVGSEYPVSIQSMTKTKTEDIKTTVDAILRLEEYGCQIIRCAVPTMEAAVALKEVKKQVHIPVVADIHFNYHFALEAIKSGVDKVRLNPGNIGGRDNVRTVLKSAKERGVSLRIGVNSGSLEKEILNKYGWPTPEALVESAMTHLKYCEDENFDQVVVAIKSSDVQLMIDTNRLFASKTDYPIHLGVTETGTVWSGTIKSAVGIGTLLSEGIGDTIRVSLLGDSVEEVKAGREIVKSLNLLKDGISFIACPTCGRLEVNLQQIMDELEKAAAHIRKPLTVAVMGCAVNGPGEAREADIGIACGKGEGLLYIKGKKAGKVPEDRIVSELLRVINDWKG